MWEKHNIIIGKRKDKSQTQNSKPKTKLIIAIEESEKPIAEYSFFKKDQKKIKEVEFVEGRKSDRISENFKSK